MILDEIDHRILRLLRQDGRMPNVKLAALVNLSPSACLRRVQAMEQAGVIRGYAAIVDPGRGEASTTVIVRITLERQTDDALKRFEAAVRRCPEVRACYLMTGDADYLLQVETRGVADYERLHTEALSRLPGVARIQSSVALRRVTAPPPPAETAQASGSSASS